MWGWDDRCAGGTLWEKERAGDTHRKEAQAFLEALRTELAGLG